MSKVRLMSYPWAKLRNFAKNINLRMHFSFTMGKTAEHRSRQIKQKT